MAYAVLQTIADGTAVTDQPTAARILHIADHYPDALEVARAHRISRYRHRATGEVRDLTENQTVGCGFRDEDLFAWIGGADLVATLSYALPVELDQLAHHEPASTPPARP